jgi:hypothetical protein
MDDIPHPSMAGKSRTELNIALNEATRLGHIAINPVARTTPPEHTPHVGMAWTADQTRQFLLPRHAAIRDRWPEVGER